MNLFSFVLRLLLCVALAANGAGVAQASARMTFEHASQGSAGRAAATPVVESASCPMHAAAHGKARVASATGVAKPPAFERAPGDSDCCKGRACSCTCVQHASCDFARIDVPGAMAAGATRPSVSRIAHAQPRLPHQLRPPIG